ncbi:hypothetical protein H0H93_012882 [Arthromyces matolae]|nr:hypothetical protein H0H93_012882 [Arthromyces matolae]
MGLVALVITALVLFSLFNRARSRATPSRMQRHIANFVFVGWMLNPPTADETCKIEISPSHPVFFGDLEKKQGVQVMVTPPTPGRREAPNST